MKILLVNPPRFEGMPICRITRCENIVRESVITPFDLLIMANIFRDNGHEVFFIDANTDSLDYFQLSSEMQEIKPDVTVFHASQDCFLHDLETAKIAKLIGSKTVLINWTFKTMIDEVYQDIKEWVDCFVVNHSYMIDIPNVIENLPKVITENTKYDFDKLPLPDWDLIKDFRKYYTRVKSISPYAVTTTSWGCPQHCLFCVPTDTLITLDDGEKISIQDVSVGTVLRGQNSENKVTKLYKRKSENIIKIEIDGGKILEVTPEHPIYTKRGWVLANDLNENDEVLVDGE